MDIVGVQHLSNIDFSGKWATVFFAKGCNLRCGFCHNPDIVLKNLPIIPEAEIFRDIDEKKGLIEGVVLSGGEPTLDPDIVNFLLKIRKRKLLIKLDTNGTRPDVIRSLIRQGLVDFIAMDIKAPFSKYIELTGIGLQDLKRLKESIEIIRNSGVEYAFRTTAIPSLSLDDFIEIAITISGSNLYIIQKYRSDITLDSCFPKTVHSIEFLERVKESISDYFSDVVIENTQ